MAHFLQKLGLPIQIYHILKFHGHLTIFWYYCSEMIKNCKNGRFPWNKILLDFFIKQKFTHVCNKFGGAQANLTII